MARYHKLYEAALNLGLPEDQARHYAHEAAVCQHPDIYYSKEADNFYCTDCKQGMGEEYYLKHFREQLSPSRDTTEKEN